MESVTTQTDAEVIFDTEIRKSLKRHKRPAYRLFISSLAAGLEIGFSLLAMAALYTQLVGSISPDVIFLLVALGYPIGFILVIVGDSDLFTEYTALATYPVLTGQERGISLLRTWGIILSGNLIGGYLFSVLLYFLVPHLATIDPASIIVIAQKVLAIDTVPMLLSAVLAGWLMGLISWLVASTKETISAILVVILITLLIGVVGLHHSIVGSLEVFSGFLLSPEITFTDYVRFQLVALLGNIIGGVFFVAGLKFSQREKAERA